MITAPALAQAPEPLTIHPGVEEYPPEALAAHLEGDVPIVLDMHVDGTLTCTQSGAPKLGALRRRSCETVVKRWPFDPDRDKSGAPVDTRVPLIVHWSIPTPTTIRFDGAAPIAPERWFSNDDYPADAIQKGEQGAVEFDYTIDVNGRPKDCHVTVSAHSPSLDATSCAVITQRARFLPALGPDGKPREAHGHGNINWQK
jgi:TonB family protein